VNYEGRFNQGEGWSGGKKALQGVADIAGVGLSAWVRIMLRRAAIREYHDAGKRLDFYSSSGSAANAGSNNV
jgi:hypothetical protein